VNEPRKHHYVPVFYQKHFVNHKGLLWVYDRCQMKYMELHPASICFQKDLYTVKPKDAPWDRRVETEIFNVIDGMSSSAIRELISMSPNRETVGNVAYFMAVQIHRTPMFARTMSAMYVSTAEEIMRLMTVDVGRMQSILDRHKRDTGESMNVSAESMVKAVRDRELKVEATETAFLSHIFSQAESTFKLIKQLDWQILVAPQDVGFITCDSPAAVVPPEGCAFVGFLVPRTVTYFPLSRQFCVRLDISRQPFRYRKISKETVQVINRNIASNSERFVMGPDKAQLMSTIKHSGSAEQDPIPRYTVETVNPDDHGSYQKLTRHPTRYFYLKGIAP
jgi:hypothetical protein